MTLEEKFEQILELCKELHPKASEKLMGQLFEVEIGVEKCLREIRNLNDLADTFLAGLEMMKSSHKLPPRT